MNVLDIMPTGNKLLLDDEEAEMIVRSVFAREPVEISSYEETPVFPVSPSKIIIIGVGLPYDLARNPGYARRYPGKHCFSTYILWIYADGNDRVVKKSWVWCKLDGQAKKFVNALFWVSFTDVTMHVGREPGTFQWDVAQIGLKKVRKLSEIQARNLLRDIGEIVDEDTLQSHVVVARQSEKNWKYAEGLCSNVRTHGDFTGVIISPSFLYGATRFRVHIPSHLGVMPRDGDYLIVGGDVYRRRTGENGFAVNSIIVLNRAPVDMLDDVELM